MDHREHARLAAIIARRRKQLARLEQEVVTVREQLARDEHKLQSLLGAARDVGSTEIIQASATKSNEVKDTCNIASKALLKCKQSKERGGKADELCIDAAACSRNVFLENVIRLCGGCYVLTLPRRPAGRRAEENFAIVASLARTFSRCDDARHTPVSNSRSPVKQIQYKLRARGQGW